jgi:transposase-like protein
LQTKAGEVRLKIPKLRQQTFETAIIERYRRRESSVAITVLSQCRAPLVRHRKIVYSAMGLVSQMSKHGSYSLENF